MKKFNLLFLLLFLCISIFGCDEEIANPTQLEQILHGIEPQVQTEIPADVLAAMKIQADEMSRWVEFILNSPDDPGWILKDPESILEEQKLILERGYDKIDFHELQKAFYTRYIDAGGIAIVGPDSVTDAHYIAAKDTILIMTHKFPILRERLKSKHKKFYMVFVGDDYKSKKNMPEMLLKTSYLEGRPDFRPSCNLSIVPEGFCHADVRGFIQPTRTFAHEFAHALDYEMELIMPGFLDKLIKLGELHNTIHQGYEIWAYGVEQWFFNDSQYREKFFRKYPVLAAMLDEWFPRVNYSSERELQTEPPYGITFVSASWEIVDE